MIEAGGNQKSADYLAAAACVVVTAGGATSALGAPSLLPTGGFEGGGSGSLAGWKGAGAVLSLRPDGRGGGHAVRVARAPGNRTYSIVAAPAPAKTVAERRYRAAGYAPLGHPGAARVREAGRGDTGRPHGRVRRRLPHRHRRWRAFPAAGYTAKHTGDVISLRVVQTSAAAQGDSFQVDDLSLTSPSADSAAPSQTGGRDRPGDLLDQGGAHLGRRDGRFGRGRIHDLPRRRLRRHRPRLGHGLHRREASARARATSTPLTRSTRPATAHPARPGSP